MTLHDNEKLCLLNYWTKELWSIHPFKPQSIDITEYSENIHENKKTLLEPLEDKIENILTDMDTSHVFVRTNRRSPKDHTLGKPLSSAEEVLDALLCSFRVLEDIEYLYEHNEPILLYIFKYFPQVQEKEFRCFVKNKELIAISQYNSNGFKPYTPEELCSVKAEINKLFPKINSAVPLNDYIFDVFIYNDSAFLIEINPYSLSDPCHFINYETVENGGFAFQTTKIILLNEN